MRCLEKYLRKTLSLLMVFVLLAGCMGMMTGCSGETDNPCGTPEAGGIPADDEPEPETPDQPSEWITRTGMELTPELDPVNAAIGHVSMELFRRSVAEPAAAGENAMISPFSILSAFAMAQAGAAGETAAEMEAVFGYTSEEITDWLAAWNASLSQGSRTSLNVANSFWYRQDFQMEESWKNTMETAYQAEFRPSDFGDAAVAEINGWCKEKTHGMIPKVVDQLDYDVETLLLNAIAFEGVWKKEYGEFQITEEEEFVMEDGTRQKVTMLYSREDTYLSAEGVCGFIKPYTDGYSFVALLPEKGTPVAELAERMDGAFFRQILDSRQAADVDAVIPEFKAEYDADQIKPVLQEMGLMRIFEPGLADLTAMGRTSSGAGLYVSRVIHKTFIELNREGTRAAAVTGLETKATSTMPEENHIIYEVRLDRPFIYVILDDNSQTPLFAGVTMRMQ